MSDKLDVMLNQWRLEAMLAPPTAPIKTAVRDEQWAHFGQAVYKNMHSEKFLKAIVCAVMDADGTENSQHVILVRLRAFLLTGTIQP